MSDSQKPQPKITDPRKTPDDLKKFFERATNDDSGLLLQSASAGHDWP